MNEYQLLTYLFLFSTGSVLGWVLEFAFRNLISARGKLSNPGLCSGPCLPLYGFGICLMYLVCSELGSTGTSPAVICLILAIAMTLLEFIVGTICLKLLHVRLWDYTRNRFNINGIICPLFSLIWGILAAAYYFLVHPSISANMTSVISWNWLKFFLGMFYGIFLIDLSHSVGLVANLKKLASEYDITIHYEKFKHSLSTYLPISKWKFFIPVRYSDIIKLKFSDAFNNFVSLAQHEKSEFISHLSPDDFCSWFIETDDGEKLVSLKHILMYFPVYLGVYFVTSKCLPIENCHPVICWIDECLEIIPVFVVPYISWHILVPVLCIYLFRNDMNAFRHYANYLMYSSLAAVCVFIIWPSYMPLRPSSYPVSGIFSFLLNVIYLIDSNTNVCPSVHVIWAFGMLFAVWNDKLFSKTSWRILWILQTLLITASTFMIKQHSVLDTMTSVPFIVIGWIVNYSKFRPSVSSGRI